jgi:uncharacterized protein YndB with AHSA1/START domain
MEIHSSNPRGEGGDGDVVLTFRRGPSDPIVHADGPGTWVERCIAAPPDTVWAAVTDINLPAEYSEEFLGARWIDAGPALGAVFIGRNQHSVIGEWEIESFIDEFEPGRVFGWATADVDQPGAQWRFRLTPVEGGTVLRFEVTLGPGPSGLTTAISSMPDKEARIIRRRIGELHVNMARTVEGIRQRLEATHPK